MSTLDTELDAQHLELAANHGVAPFMAAWFSMAEMRFRPLPEEMLVCLPPPTAMATPHPADYWPASHNARYRCARALMTFLHFCHELRVREGSRCLALSAARSSPVRG